VIGAASDGGGERSGRARSGHGLCWATGGPPVLQAATLSDSFHNREKGSRAMDRGIAALGAPPVPFGDG